MGEGYLKSRGLVPKRMHRNNQLQLGYATYGKLRNVMGPFKDSRLLVFLASTADHGQLVA